MRLPKAHVRLSIKLRSDLAPALDRFRFARRFSSKTEAIEELLDFALTQNPKRGPDGKLERPQ